MAIKATAVRYSRPLENQTCLTIAHLRLFYAQQQNASRVLAIA